MNLPSYIRHTGLRAWIESMVQLCNRLPAELMSVRNLLLSGMWRLRGRWDLDHPTIGS